MLKKTINGNHNQTFTKQNVIEVLKLSPTTVIAIHYYIADRNINIKFGQILRVPKCNILVVTQALLLYLICMPEARGPQALGLLAFISGKALVPVLQLLHTPLSY